MDNKTDLRIRAKSIRKTLDIGNISNILTEKIRNFEPYIKAKNVMIFYPKKYEINLLGLLNDDKNFYLPKVCNEKLYICPFKSGDKLIKSCFDVEEPCSSPVDSKILDLIIVPALMADKDNYRLGYGGGFYDRFLENNSEIDSVLPIAKDLCVESLPHEDFDRKVKYIITN